MSDYDYLNARVRGEATTLLAAPFYDQVLSTPGIDPLVDALFSSDYGPELRESYAKDRGVAAVESALRRALVQRFDHIRSIAPDAPRRLLEVQLQCWDVDAVRAIVRGVARAADPAQIKAAVLTTGLLTEDQIEELVSQPDIVAVADQLVTWDYAFAAPLRQTIRDYADPLDLPAIDAALDEACFEWARSQLAGSDPNDAIVLAIVRQQIDLANVLRALRCLKERERGGAPAPAARIPGGSLRASLWQQVDDAPRVEAALEALGNTHFASAVEKGILEFGSTQRLASIERFLEMAVIEAGCRTFRRDPLGVGVPLGYLWRKHNEFVNLRILLRGKAYQVPATLIREELLIV